MVRGHDDEWGCGDRGRGKEGKGTERNDPSWRATTSTSVGTDASTNATTCTSSMSRPLYDVDDCGGGDDDVEEEGVIDEGKDFDDDDDEDDIVVMDDAMFAVFLAGLGREVAGDRTEVGLHCHPILRYPFHCIM